MLRETFAVFTYLVAVSVMITFLSWLNNLPESYPALNAILPFSIDRRPGVHLGLSLPRKVVLNIALFGVFALQHNIMSRLVVKAKMRTLIPFAWERSVFVLSAAVALGAVIFFWQPLPTVIYAVPSPYDKVMVALSLVSLAAYVHSTWLMDSNELLGVRQAFLGLDERDYPPPEFKTVGLFKFVRHPIYATFLAYLCCAPVMTAGRLLLTGCILAFVLWSLPLEETTLQLQLGEPYGRYRKAVPALLPSLSPYEDEKKSGVGPAKKLRGGKAE